MPRDHDGLGASFCTGTGWGWHFLNAATGWCSTDGRRGAAADGPHHDANRIQSRGRAVSPTSAATILAAVSDILPPVPTVTDVFPAIAYSAIVLPVANVFPAIPHIFPAIPYVFPAVPAVLESVAPLAVMVSSLILCEDGGRDEE